MKKPVYKHPDFVVKTADKRIESENKRLWLSLTIDNELKESIVVILKNPSRATKEISDKTVFNITNYIFKNRNKFKPLNNIGNIIIVNLIPFYETYSELLANKNIKIVDKENLKTIETLTKTHKNVIIAWGNHPSGLYNEYEILKAEVLGYLKSNGNSVHYIDKFSDQGNPKHAQIWGYEDELKQMKQD